MILKQIRPLFLTMLCMHLCQTGVIAWGTTYFSKKPFPIKYFHPFFSAALSFWLSVRKCKFQYGKNKFLYKNFRQSKTTIFLLSDIIFHKYFFFLKDKTYKNKNHQNETSKYLPTNCRPLALKIN